MNFINSRAKEILVKNNEVVQYENNLTLFRFYVEMNDYQIALNRDLPLYRDACPAKGGDERIR